MARTFWIALFCLMVVAADARRSKWKMRNKTTRKPNVEEDDKAPLDNIIEINKNIKEISEDDIFEGDIVMNNKLKKYINRKLTNPDDEDSPFDAIANGQWPNGKVPYVFASGFPYRSVVQRAIEEYNKNTCVRLVRRTSERDYVYFMQGGGCYSMIGRQGGRQQISLGSGCGQVGVAIHEIMHALGFFHEQSRRDRDSYIKVNFGNINRQMWYNFEKYRSGQASTLGEPYDKQSVMHYGNYAFSINGRKTIESISNPSERLGQRSGLSRIDINQLNKYYRCPGTGTKKTTTTTQSPPVPGGCSDGYTFCSTLARGLFCSTEWVKTNCKKSCKDPSCNVSCVNKSKYCVGWAKRNTHCPMSKGCCDPSSRFSSYMKTDCAKACEFC